jgi:5-methylcytosine-specific restriction endonuclease McrA
MRKGDNRTPYEFSLETKREALARHDYKCVDCGAEDDRTNRLQLDHEIAIWFARENPALTVEVIRSIANCVPRCARCHSEKHKRESRKMYQELAPVVLQRYLELIVDHTKDDWRSK